MRRFEFVLGATALAFFAACGRAQAHALAQDADAMFSVSLSGRTPDAAAVTALSFRELAPIPPGTGAQAGHDGIGGGCALAISSVTCRINAQATAYPGQFLTYAETFPVDVVFTNTSASALDHVAYSLMYSAFEPDQSHIAASVDDLAMEYAAYSADIVGYDDHACSAAQAFGPETVIPGPGGNPASECIETSPDAGVAFPQTGAIGAGQSVTARFVIDVSVTASSQVPAPWAALLPGSLTLAGVRLARRRLAG